MKKSIIRNIYKQGDGLAVYLPRAIINKFNLKPGQKINWKGKRVRVEVDFLR